MHVARWQGLGSVMVGLVVVVCASQSFAGDIEWSGIYRIEANNMNNLNLNGDGAGQTYGLHHLSLRPKIVAADGLTIFGQFELFNFSGSNGAFGNSQLGQVLGSGLGDSNFDYGGMDSQMTTRGAAQELLVSQLYLSWVHEFGALIAGRAPIEFGLGMTYSAGRRAFDHWFDTRDLVGYKFILGNIWLLPMFGKVHEGSLSGSDDVTDLMFQFQYDNPETDLEMGAFYSERKGSDQRVGPTAFPIGGAGATKGEINSKTVSVYVLKDTERFRSGIEGTFVSGQAGVRTASGSEVSMTGYGVAVEFEYRPEASLWTVGTKGGIATGDDANTDGSFEGFAFNRNYDVAMLLFNRPMGVRDVLRTAALGGGPQDYKGDLNNLGTKPDVERLSNVAYLAPYLSYRWSEKWELGMVLATGWLNSTRLVNPDNTTKVTVGSSLGYELDLILRYKPRKGLEWINEAGFLQPGDAFQLVNGDSATFAYGLTSKAAISF